MVARSRAVIKYRSARNESKEMVCSTRSRGTNNEGLKKRRAQLAEVSNTIREVLSKIPLDNSVSEILRARPRY